MTQVDSTIDNAQGEPATSFQSVALAQQTSQLYAARALEVSNCPPKDKKICAAYISKKIDL
jgi:hypothetical protein